MNSEASHLVTLNTINGSIQITQNSIEEYRRLRREGKVDDVSQNEDVRSRMLQLYNSARTIISDIESSIDNPYSAEGFYKIFAAGFLATSYLWKGVNEFKHPKSVRTNPVSGGVKVVDEEGIIL